MDEEMLQEHITVDLTDCNDIMEFWNRIRDAFDYGETFGANWDAFIDVLTVECPAHKVTVIGANTLPKEWIYRDGRTISEKIRRVLQINKEFKERYHYEFEYELLDA